MIEIRKSNQRGHGEFGWLSALYTFSFSNYHDPRYMGFGPLRVINEDRVAGGSGFAPHSHANMEIITYILEGGLQHRDSSGGGGVIRPGDIQYMSAGTGVSHSEVNASPSETVHLLQIWIMPKINNTPPRYEEKKFPLELRRNQLCLLVSGDGRDDSIVMRQDASLYGGFFETGQSHQYKIANGRGAFLQIARGSMRVNGEHELAAGDILSAQNETAIQFEMLEQCEFIFFDLPMAN